MPSIRQVDSSEHLQELFALSLVVVLKHSLTCPASASAYHEVARFVQTYPLYPFTSFLCKHTAARRITLRNIPGCGMSLPKCWF